jgi:fatty acid-binding protein DegV
MEKNMNYKKWTNQDKEFIRDNFNNMSDDELALRLSQITSSSISVAMVRTQRRKLGIKKNRGRLSKKSNITISSIDIQPVVSFEENQNF